MKKVIIIEDDPIVAHIYQKRLEKEGYSADTCADGQTGFYRIHEYNPDAILLDLMLPKMNGVDILKKIRAQSKYARVPIVVFTNAYVPNMIQEAFAAGASQVFNKATITPRQILDALHILLFVPNSDPAAPTPNHYPTVPGMGSVGLTGRASGSGDAGPAGGGDGAGGGSDATDSAGRLNGPPGTDAVGGGTGSGHGSDSGESGGSGSGGGAGETGGGGDTHEADGRGASRGGSKNTEHTDPLATVGESSFHSPRGSSGSPAQNTYSTYSPHGYSPEMLGLSSGGGNPISMSPNVTTDDSAFQSELHEAFVKAKPETMAALRKLLQDFTKAPDEKARMPHLVELYRRIHALTGSAGIAGFGNVAQMASALEVLLKDLYEKPKNINASTIRTVAHSIDFLAELFRCTERDWSQLPPANILVVDDEILSRRAIIYALEKANLKAVNLDDPELALKMATETVFDLIFLDVLMPAMDGFELCQKIRSHSTNRTTPIIFVTSLTDFKSRAKSSLSGGNDLIAKPFMFIELTVKALTHVLRGRLNQRMKAA